MATIWLATVSREWTWKEESESNVQKEQKKKSGANSRKRFVGKKKSHMVKIGKGLPGLPILVNYRYVTHAIVIFI